MVSRHISVRQLTTELTGRTLVSLYSLKIVTKGVVKGSVYVTSDGTLYAIEEPPTEE